jgi:hypothetical protein
VPARDRASEALDALEVAAVLWLVGEGNFARVVDTACSVLVAGGNGEALAALAGEPRRQPVYPADADDAVRDALAEQGRPLPERDTREAQQRAVAAMAVSVLAGTVSPRYAAAWAHRSIGHTGLALAQPLVEMDDRYDTVGFSNDTVEAVDHAVLDFCRSVATNGRHTGQ